MSKEVDERVVDMQFNNKQFEEGIRSTLAALDKLNQSLKLEGASRGFEQVSAAANHVQLGNIEQGVNSISDRFHAMSVVAITALANIANRAAETGFMLVKSLTVDPINQGLQEYQTNINSIQTILSNTRWQNTGLNDVIKALNELNLYSDQTIYNFSQMAHNIGTFTAAGVKLEVATNAIKGIANLAAVSGSSAEQASNAMYQLSQAIATGTLKLIDWNSVVNAGLGGKVFQDALVQTARVHGVAVDKMIKDAGSFRGSLEKGWATASILTETLSHFTADLNEEQLISMGYSKQQALDIIAMGKDATDAATKVKTLTQLLGTMRESAGSGWAQTWQIIFGDFDEARNLFTSVNDTLGGFIKNSADNRNELLQTWKDLGGRDVLIDSIGNSFEALLAVLKPIREGFREIFPKATAVGLYNITYAIRSFTETLKIGGENADKLRRTFAGLFAIFGIGWDAVKAAATVLARLLGIANKGTGDFLTITASIGDFLVELRKAIQEGKGFEKIFGAVGNVLAVPINLLRVLVGYAAKLFDNFDAARAARGLTGLVAKFEPLTRLGEVIVDVWERVLHVLDNVANDASQLGTKILDAFGPFSDYIRKAVGEFNFDDLFKGLNTGLFGTFILTIRNAFGRGGVTGLLHNATQALGQLTDTMQTMQNTLRAATLLEIALAIGILTISVKELSRIPADDLTKSLTAITVMFGQLLGALTLFSHATGVKGIVKIPLITAGLILLAVAVDILAVAVKKLADLSWEQLTKGLTGVTVLIGALTAAVRLMPPAPGMIASSIALNLLAVAVKILASAVSDISGMSWEEIAKGLTGVSAVLVALALFTKFAAVEKGGVLAGAGIVLLATGIKILALAMLDFAKLSWEDIGKGLTAMAGGLLLMGIALSAIPPTAPLIAVGIIGVSFALGLMADALKKMGGMSWSDIGAGLTAMAGGLLLIGLALTLIPPYAPLTAAGILIVAASLGMMADALKQMGSMGWGEIAKGLVTLAGALLIIAVAVNVMSGALGGAAAILIVAGALAILAPILLTFGQMSWGEIVKGLATLAGVFIILGIAGALLTPVIPTLLGLGVAVALIGVGLLAAGVGLLAFSLAITALSISGAALTTTIVAIVSALIGLIPTIIKGLGVALVTLASVLGNAVPAMTQALTAILIALLDAIIAITPKLAEALLKLILYLIDILEKATPRMAEAGYNILLAILKSIRSHIREMTDVALEIVAEFIEGMGDGLPKVLKAGADFIIKFINGLADTIRNQSEELGKAGGNLATAIIEGMAKGLLGGSSVISKAAKDVAKNALNAAKEFLGINSPARAFVEVGEFSAQGMAVGIYNLADVVAGAAEDMGDGALESLRRSLSGIPALMKNDINMAPTITPVLDLSGVRKTAGQIGSILSTTPMSVQVSSRKATDVSAGFQESQDAADDDESRRGGDTFNYNQYNNSPKALSEAEIYRQTKNQLAVAKGVVSANA